MQKLGLPTKRAGGGYDQRELMLHFLRNYAQNENSKYYTDTVNKFASLKYQYDSAVNKLIWLHAAVIQYLIYRSYTNTWENDQENPF